MKAGDKVKVIDNGYVCDTFTIENLTNDIEIIKRFAYGVQPKNGIECEVIKTSLCDAIIRNDIGQIFVVTIFGLELTSQKPQGRIEFEKVVERGNTLVDCCNLTVFKKSEILRRMMHDWQKRNDSVCDWEKGYVSKYYFEYNFGEDLIKEVCFGIKKSK